MLVAGADEAVAPYVLEALVDLGDGAGAEIEAAWDGLDTRSRSLACEVLGRLPGEAGLGRLRAALSAQDCALRIAAGRALAAKGDGGALPGLLARLEIAPTLHWDPDEGEEADEEKVLARAITEIVRSSDAEAREVAVSLIDERLQNAEEPFRFAATELLGSIGRSEDAAQIKGLLSDPSERVRRAAIMSLVAITDDCAEAIRVAMADESRMVRIGVAVALTGSDRADVLEDLATLADDSEVRVRAAAMRAVGEWVSRRERDENLRDEALAVLATGLGRGGMEAMATLESLRRIGGSAAVALTHSALGTDDAAIVEAAIACLGEHGTKHDIEAVVGLFSHPHWAVRARAVEVAANRRLVSALPAMMRGLDTEQDEFAREAFLQAVSSLESLAV